MVADDAQLCDVCGEPVDYETAHNSHDEDCPVPRLPGQQPGAERVRDALATCACDVWVHPECCPECQV